MKTMPLPPPTYQQLINTPVFSWSQQRQSLNTQDHEREQAEKGKCTIFFYAHNVW
ncbi:MAG: hypothetical protein NTV49_12345 [Kiritimatiellaeota bacterium]|nr:hypothetical protein [Kiritimatiellota bacterium]